MRESGYYWVKRASNPDWEIYEWDKSARFFVKGDFYFDDDEFDEIDERQITRRPVCKDDSLTFKSVILTGEPIRKKGKMKQLVYLLAFGPECLEQFKICLQGLKRCEVDIALITDQPFKNKRVKVYKTVAPIDVSHCYSYRTEFRQLIDISDYDRVWYMDCDFLIYEDIFSKYADSEQVLVCDEPGIGLWSDFFNQDLSEIEKPIYKERQAINAGIYSAPKHLFHFFDYFDLSVKAIRLRKNLHIPEQMVLNSIFVRYRQDFNMNVIYDVGFPSKGIYKNVNHYACYKFEDKLTIMQNENLKNANRLL